MDKKFVVAVAVLGTLIFLRGRGFIQSRQRFGNAQLMMKTTNAMRQVGVAALQYEQDHKDQLPPMKDPASFQKALLPYALTKDIFISPATGQPFMPNASLAGKKLSSISGQTILIYDQNAIPGPGGFNDRVRVVSISQFHGSKAMAERNWQREKTASGIR